MLRFQSIHIDNWRQFRTVDVRFHERMTIITGANGAGKTTILNVLSQHFGWNLAFVGTLRISKSGARQYFSGVEEHESVESDENPQLSVGELHYSDASIARLTVPRQGDSFQISLNNRQNLPGVYITSHRPVYSYQKVTEIPTEVQAGEQLFQQYLDNIRLFYTPRARVESPSHRLKAALISLANFGYGNEVVEANDKAREAFEGFSDVLRKVLPADLDFRRIAIRMPEVVLECGSGDFSLDAASGGVSALIDVSWQIFMQSLSTADFAVVMDEPENHLHPRLQRSILPGLLDAFPRAQFIVATHNPFVVTSVRDSTVVVLDFNAGKVESAVLADVDRSATANRVLSDVLGVPFPAPIWVEAELTRIVSSIEQQQLTPSLLDEVRDRLREVGLDDLFPRVVDQLLPERSTDGGDSE
jgi:predicted ATP-binding protein involved in virulence